MKLKPGVEINHKKKKYIVKIPDKIFEEIYGKEKDAAKKKFEFAASKSKRK